MDYLTIFCIGVYLGAGLMILLLLLLEAFLLIAFFKPPLDDLLDDTLFGAIIDHKKYIQQP